MSALDCLHGNQWILQIGVNFNVEARQIELMLLCCVYQNQVNVQQTWVSAKIVRFPGFEPTPDGIHVLITCGFSSSWSWSIQSKASLLAASSKPYRMVFKKLYAGFGCAILFSKYKIWLDWALHFKPLYMTLLCQKASSLSYKSCGSQNNKISVTNLTWQLVDSVLHLHSIAFELVEARQSKRNEKRVKLDYFFPLKYTTR